MIDYASVLTLVTSTVGAADGVTKLAGSIKDVVKSGKVTGPELDSLRDDVSRLYDQAISAKALNLELLASMADLKAAYDAQNRKIADMESFDAERSQYVLRQLAPHSHAYIQERTADPAEPMRYYCVPCFDDRRKSILQFNRPDYHADILQCPRCKNEVRIAKADEGPSVMIGRVKRSGWDYDPFENE